ncbi:MAG: SRPBCC family protein [Terracidiphilus sp.]
MGNKIEKRIELNAPVSRVWRALTEYREFGEWFRVALDGPFAPGKVARGKILHPGDEHIVWEALIEKMEPEQLFSFTWAQVRYHDKERYSPDYSQAPRTLVEFRLKETATGTLLVLTESGFENVPAEWRTDAFRGNDGGWTQQMKNIESYVTE